MILDFFTTTRALRMTYQEFIYDYLDAVGVLQDGNDAELRSEIPRQIEAGRRNGNRFVMSLGSPVTPGTSMARVRSYCDLAHEIGTA